MPPPNHDTASAPGFSATKKRTFMCTVGTYGLRGCRTRDTPMAWNERPARSARDAVADAGSALPVTWERLTPPRSNMPPSSIRQLTPPPPSGRVHSSRRNLLPSISSSLPTIRCCRPARYFFTKLPSMALQRTLFRTDGPKADVAAHLAAGEADALGDFISAP